MVCQRQTERLWDQRCQACYFYRRRHNGQDRTTPRPTPPVKHLPPAPPLRRCATCREYLPISEYGHKRFHSTYTKEECLRCRPPIEAKPHSAIPKDRQSIHIRASKYGLRADDYDRMLIAQRGGCAICKKIQPYGVLVIDHDHETGIVRGLLCVGCNAGLGLLGDTLEQLQEAVRYLGGSVAGCNEKPANHKGAF